MAPGLFFSPLCTNRFRLKSPTYCPNTGHTQSACRRTSPPLPLQADTPGSILHLWCTCRNHRGAPPPAASSTPSPTPPGTPGQQYSTSEQHTHTSAHTQLIIVITIAARCPLNLPSGSIIDHVVSTFIRHTLNTAVV